MTDDSLFVGHKPQPTGRRPLGEHVWTMTKGSEQARAALRDRGVAGIELQLFRGDDFANGRLYPSRAATLEASAVRRQQMFDRGWRDA